MMPCRVVEAQQYARIVEDGALIYEALWQPATSVTPAERAIIEGALRRTPRIFPDENFESEGCTGSRDDQRRACRIAFQQPFAVKLVPTDKWDPYYHLKRTDGTFDLRSQSVPGRIQAYKVEPMTRYADQAVSRPLDFLNDKAAEVRLRLQDTKQWLYVTVLYDDPR